MVFIRVDEHREIGRGHMVRCIALAREMKRRGCDVVFLSAFMEEGTALYLKTLAIGVRRFVLDTLDSVGGERDVEICTGVITDAGDTSILLVDSYRIGHAWHARVKSHVDCLGVIDDLSDRHYLCDVLVDQSFNKRAGDYKTLIPDSSKLLVGSEYCLVRREFLAERAQSLERRRGFYTTANTVGAFNLLISMGGVDIGNASATVLGALSSMAIDIELSVTVVLGSLSPHLQSIRETITAAGSASINLLVDVVDMAPIMARADLCVSAAGTTVWEACVLGLPLIVLVTADNQLHIAEELARNRAIKLAGRAESVSERRLAAVISHTIKNLEDMKRMSYLGSKICDGRGCERVASTLIDSL